MVKNMSLVDTFAYLVPFHHGSKTATTITDYAAIIVIC